jgi:hypothetical protein
VKTLFAALAVTAILATSAVAKTERTRGAHIQHNNSVGHNTTSHNPVSHSSETQLSHNCRFHDGETDPDVRIRLQLVRDCRDYENVDAE